MEHGYTVIEQPNNIYYVEGALFPIQLVVTKPAKGFESEEAESIWLNILSPNISKENFYKFVKSINTLDIRHGMFADTISSIVSDANENKIEIWKEHDATMNSAMKRIMSKEIKESNDECRDMIKKATKDAKDKNITDASDLEALGYDKDTAEGAISILTELGIIQ